MSDEEVLALITNLPDTANAIKRSVDYDDRRQWWISVTVNGTLEITGFGGTLESAWDAVQSQARTLAEAIL